MQINGTSSGPTMAASEPPEPPPRNPDRINASLHKLSESKNIKSLDSSIATINEKTINNNKPLKPILSLDHGNSSNTTSFSNSAATATPATNSKSGTAASATSATATVAGTNITSAPTLQSSTAAAPLVYTKRATSAAAAATAAAPTAAATAVATTTVADITPTPGVSAGDSVSPLSSNGSSSNQTLISPMTIDNQQHRLSFPNKNEVHATLMAQQQQQHLNGSNATTALLNGSVAGTNAGSNALNANNANANLATSSVGAAANHVNATNSADSPTKLREENERLSAEIHRLRKLLENSPEGAVGGIDLSDSNSCGDAHSTDGSGSMPQQRVDRLEAELRSAKSQIMTLRIERKKLRADKSDLLAQVKQLCASLQDKEQELRDFIRNFQDRVRETETNNAKLTGDRERERWQLLKQARDEAERSLALAQQLNARDLQLQRLQDQLQEARRQLSGCLSDQESLLSFAPLTPPSAASAMINQMNATVTANNVMRNDDSGRGNSNSLSAFSSSLSGGSGATAGDRNSCSNDSGLRNSSDRESTGGDLNFSDGTCENGPCITVDPDSISLVSSQNMYQYGTPKERSPTLSPLNSAAYSRSVEQLGSPVESDGPGAVARKFAPKTGTLSARNGRGGTWGSISRVFARSRNKNKALSADGAVEYADYSWSPLSEEGYAEKLRLLRDAAQLPMERWRASQVLAWLEVALGMPQYSTRCAENVKSGKVLLELNDGELEAGLGLVHPMHRKKLRLAIEEQRRPEMVRYPMITQLGHTWVASEWLPDIGLPQYADSFLHSLVDARMLDTLSKKELEKFLGVTRKFHQASIVHGIHVLRIVKYDRQTLAMRRVQSENVDTDPIVWTNQRFIRWARSIDLGEYAENLKDSGVHGGLVVLEPSFSGDTMATALGIPPSKNIIRRHLTTEFDALILPARATLGQGIRSGCGIVPITGPGGLQHYATTDRRSNGALRISAWKGSQSSLSKAFRFNTKSSRSGSSIGDRSSFGNSTSPTPSYSSSEGGGGIYATIGGHPPHSAPFYSSSTHHFPPPTTAPPPPPPSASAPGLGAHIGGGSGGVNIFNYAPPGHRVSAPPVSSSSTAESMTDPNALYEQHRRVKSISDIGMSAGITGSVGGTAAAVTTCITGGTTASLKSVGSMGSSSGGGGGGGLGSRSGSVGGGGSGSAGGCASGSSGSPV
ncbi:kazrin isoform X3 [Zeugodacus cucurbitae]|uniref:kazrin isoform X3 n=1 Tax=Zeugodacus cucurbitae TaxID=28588 RepID=UPI0023D96D4E|nr:kazrin isoform X3 [Zeugodacus cucurbitae]